MPGPASGISLDCVHHRILVAVRPHSAASSQGIDPYQEVLLHFPCVFPPTTGTIHPTGSGLHMPIQRIKACGLVAPAERSAESWFRLKLRWNCLAGRRIADRSRSCRGESTDPGESTSCHLGAVLAGVLTGEHPQILCITIHNAHSAHMRTCQRSQRCREICPPSLRWHPTTPSCSCVSRVNGRFTPCITAINCIHGSLAPETEVIPRSDITSSAFPATPESGTDTPAGSPTPPSGAGDTPRPLVD